MHLTYGKRVLQLWIIVFGVYMVGEVNGHLSIWPKKKKRKKKVDAKNNISLVQQINLVQKYN